MKAVIRVMTILAMVAALLPLQAGRADAQVISFDAGELLGKPTANSVTVNVVPSQAVTLRVQYGTSPGVYTSTTGTVGVGGGAGGEVTISGLSADTRYYYRVQYNTGDGQWENRSEHTFHTQRSAGSAFTFVMQSDAHIEGGPLNDLAIYANTLANMAADEPDFMIDLGDMFVVSGSNAQVRASYLVQRDHLETVSGDAAVFLAIGNHENEEGWFRSGSNPTLPISSINARKEFFANPVPDSFYTGDTQNNSGLGVSGDGLRETYYSWEWGDVLFVVLDPFWNTTTRPHDNPAGADPVETRVGDRWDWTLGIDQYNWLQQTLSSSNKSMKIVISHHLTGGATDYGRGGGQAVDAGFEWGESDDATFEANRPGWGGDSIHEILRDNGVDAVFHGHDHCFAREVRGGIVYQEVPMPSALNASANFCTNYGSQIDNSGHVRVQVLPSGLAAVSYVRGSTGADNGTVLSIYGLSPGGGGYAPIRPIADAGPDQTRNDVNGNGTESVTLDGSASYDVNGTVTGYRWLDGGTQIATGATPTVNLPVGVNEITLEVTDNDGWTGDDTVTITVNAAPVADAGPDQTVVDGNDNGVQRVDLDGSGSSAPGGSIVSHVWTVNGTQIATGTTPFVNLGLGTHDIVLTVTDLEGLTGTDTVIIKVNSPPIMPEPDGAVLTVEARYGNVVQVSGFQGGSGSVHVAFSDPAGGPVCADFTTQNGSGNPGCDLHPEWTTTATGLGGPAEVTIYDLAITDFDTSAETVDTSIADPGGELSFGCNGSVAVSYGADIDDGATATRMVPGPNATIDFSEPGTCPGMFDDATVDIVTGQPVYLTAWDSDGDRTLETRQVQKPFVCPTAATPFNDVPASSFAYDDITCIYGLGLTTGTTASTYSPDNVVTREQMAAFLARLARLLGVTQAGATHPFIDVATTSFAYDDIALIYTLGVTTGTGDGTTYSPDDPVTREQMAAFLARLYSVLFGSPSSPVLALVVDTPFIDVPAASFARYDIARIYGLDITNGTSPTTYSPANHVTREQMAAFLARLIRILKFV